MKVILLYPIKTLNIVEKMIAAILKRNSDAFKDTSKQFIKNNQAYQLGFTGMTA